MKEERGFLHTKDSLMCRFGLRICIYFSMICAEKPKQGIAMHIFDYTFLKDDLLPAQLVSLASNISMLKVMSAVRKQENKSAFAKLEQTAKIESIKA